MSWRNQVTNQEETKAVKQTLSKAGYNAKVGHNSNGWLHIEVFVAKPSDCLCAFSDGFYCKPCKDAMNKAHDPALKIAQDVTGRTGEYHGYIGIQINIKKESK